MYLFQSLWPGQWLMKVTPLQFPVHLARSCCLTNLLSPATSYCVCCSTLGFGNLLFHEPWKFLYLLDS